MRKVSVPGAIRVLLATKDAGDYALIQGLLSSATEQTDVRYELGWVKTYKEGLAELMQARHSVGLVSDRLGKKEGLELLRVVTSIGCKVPIIFVGGKAIHKSEVAEILKVGAADYLDRGLLDAKSLRHSLDYAVNCSGQEQKASRSQDYLAQILGTTFDGVMVLDKNYVIAEVNEQFLRQAGLSREDVIGHPCYKVTHHSPVPCEESGHPCPFLAACESRQPQHAEHIHKDKFGNDLYVKVYCSPLFDVDGQIEYVVEIIQDFTEHKKTEDELLKSEEKFRGIVECINDGIALTNEAGILIEWNQALEHLTGLKPKDVLGKYLWDVHHLVLPPERRTAEGYQAYKIMMQRLLETGELQPELKVYKERFACVGGEVRIAEMMPFVVKTPKGFLLGNVIRDVTERQQAEDAIRDTKQAFEDLVNSIEGIVWRADPRTFQYSFVSSQAKRILGYPIERWLNEPSFWVNHLHPEDREWGVEFSGKAIAEIRPRSIEYRMIAADGRAIWFRDIVTVAVEDGQPVQIQGVMVDITEQKFAEIARDQEAALNASIEELSKNLLMAETIQDITDLTLKKAKEITGSPYGYVGIIDPATGYLISPTLSRDVWAQCKVNDKDIVFKKFTGAWGWVLKNKKPLLSNNLPTDPRSSGTPEGHIPIERFLSVPALHGDSLVGQIAVANAGRDYTERDLVVLERLAAVYALGIRRRQAEIALHMSQEQLRSVVTQAPIVLFATDQNGVVTFSEGKGLRALDRGRKKAVKKSAFDAYSGNPKVQENIRRALAGETLVDVVPIDSVFFETWYSPQLDADGNIIGVLGVAVNVTERERAANERRAHEQYLMQLNDITIAALQSPDLVSTLNTLAQQLGKVIGADNCCCISLWDEKSKTLLPAAASGSLAQTCLKGVSILGELALTESAIQAGNSVVIEDLTNSPLINPRTAAKYSICSMLGLPLKSGDNKLGAAVIGLKKPHKFTSEEINRCEQAATQVSLAVYKAQLLEETRRRAEELETLAEASAAMRFAQTRNEILAAMLGQVIVLFNGTGGAIGMFNASRGEVVIELGAGVWEYWSRQHVISHQDITRHVYATGQPYLTDDLANDHLYRHSGEANDAHCAACMPLIAREQAMGVLWLGRQEPFTQEEIRLLTAILDMTANALHRQALHEDLQVKLKALQDAQARLVQSEKLAAIGQLISGVAHELNNPLTSVILHTQMMQRRSLDENTKRDLEKIVSEALRAAKIVRGLLDFARQRPAERRTVYINDVLKSSMDFVSYELRAHNIQYSLDLSADIPVTMADPHQLQQVFINLVTNAWQAISGAEDQGSVRITTEVGPSKFIEDDTSHRPVIRILFQDNGPGIPQEVLSQVFDPFFTTKPEGSGTGLGLSICHGIIAEHGGHIWVESELGRGSTFVVEIPVVVSDQDEIIPAQYDSRPEIHGDQRILIIDDEPNVLEILTRALRSQGYQVDAMDNAAEALKGLSKRDYTFILCDIRMPGLSGPVFYRKVRARDSELAKRIIFITGDVVNGGTSKFIKEENVLYLPKPFDLDDLFKLIRSISDRAKKSESLPAQAVQ